MRTHLLVAFLCLSLARPGAAATFEVPSDYPDIASVLELAGCGDTIVLAPGHYTGPGFSDLRIDIPGSVTVTAPAGAESTAIDLQGAGFVSIGDTLNYSTPSQLVLNGLTLENGATALEIGAYSALVARHCVFQGNSLAIVVTGTAASAALDSCYIADNGYAVVLEDGGTLAAADDNFRSNYCAVWAYPGSTVDIRQSMFFYHDWTLVFEGASAEISKSLLYLNFVGIRGSDTLETEIAVECSNVFSRFDFNYAGTPDQTGQNGNISQDPLFCDTTAETSLSVAGISPLLPENNACAEPIGHVEIGCCCVGKLGNVNYDNQDMVDVADIQTLIDNLFLTLSPLVCPEEADLNFDFGIDITDLQILIDNQFLSLSPLGCCP